MDFAAFTALITSVFSIALPLSDTVDVTLGSLAIWSMVLGIGLSVWGRLRH